MELPKDDPDLLRVHDELMAQFDAGRQTAVEWEEVEGMLGGAGRRDRAAGLSGGQPDRIAA